MNPRTKFEEEEKMKEEKKESEGAFGKWRLFGQRYCLSSTPPTCGTLGSATVG
jgi:hypothetical protein